MKKITATALCLTFFACTNQASQQKRESGFSDIANGLGEDRTSKRAKSNGSFKPSQGQGSEVNSEKDKALEDTKDWLVYINDNTDKKKLLKDPVARKHSDRYYNTPGNDPDTLKSIDSEKSNQKSDRRTANHQTNNTNNTIDLRDLIKDDDDNKKSCWDWFCCCFKKKQSNHQKNRITNNSYGDTVEYDITSRTSTLPLNLIEQLQATKINESGRMDESGRMVSAEIRLSDDLVDDNTNYKKTNNPAKSASFPKNRLISNDHPGY